MPIDGSRRLVLALCKQNRSKKRLDFSVILSADDILTYHKLHAAAFATYLAFDAQKFNASFHGIDCGHKILPESWNDGQMLRRVLREGLEIYVHFDLKTRYTSARDPQSIEQSNGPDLESDLSPKVNSLKRKRASGISDRRNIEESSTPRSSTDGCWEILSGPPAACTRLSQTKNRGTLSQMESASKLARRRNASESNDKQTYTKDFVQVCFYWHSGTENIIADDWPCSDHKLASTTTYQSFMKFFQDLVRKIAFSQPGSPAQRFLDRELLIYRPFFGSTLKDDEKGFSENIQYDTLGELATKLPEHELGKGCIIASIYLYLSQAYSPKLDGNYDSPRYDTVAEAEGDLRKGKILLPTTVICSEIVGELRKSRYTEGPAKGVKNRVRFGIKRNGSPYFCYDFYDYQGNQLPKRGRGGTLVPVNDVRFLGVHEEQNDEPSKEAVFSYFKDFFQQRNPSRKRSTTDLEASEESPSRVLRRVGSYRAAPLRIDSPDYSCTTPMDDSNMAGLHRGGLGRESSGREADGADEAAPATGDDSDSDDSDSSETSSDEYTDMVLRISTNASSPKLNHQPEYRLTVTIDSYLCDLCRTVIDILSESLDEENSGARGLPYKMTLRLKFPESGQIIHMEQETMALRTALKRYGPDGFFSVMLG